MCLCSLRLKWHDVRLPQVFVGDAHGVRALDLRVSIERSIPLRATSLCVQLKYVELEAFSPCLVRAQEQWVSCRSCALRFSTMLLSLNSMCALPSSTAESLHGSSPIAVPISASLKFPCLARLRSSLVSLPVQVLHGAGRF
eukprot:1820676-Pleurochrysis_carterae.AAC.1